MGKFFLTDVFSLAGFYLSFMIVIDSDLNFASLLMRMSPVFLPPFAGYISIDGLPIYVPNKAHIRELFCRLYLVGNCFCCVPGVTKTCSE